MRYKIMIILTLVLLVYGCGQKNDYGAKQNAEQFIRYLAMQDIENAKLLASGRTLYNISSKKDVPQAEISEINLQTIAESPEWAEIYVAVKMMLSTGDMDIAWYRMNMNKDNGVWKVYYMEPTGPEITAESSNANTEDIETAKDVFNNYIGALTSDSRESIQYLAGPARRVQNMAIETMGGVPLITNIESPVLTPLLWTEDVMVCKAEYKVDGRIAKVVITYARVDKNNWKITDISSL